MSGELQGRRVLVVEDEGAQREVLKYNLEAEGFQVILAENGDEALLLVQEENPDLIVLDWMLPNVSGIEVCRRVKADPETRQIPIIMLSARSDEGDRVRGLETGADDYVVKPYSVVELMARVRTQLSERHGRVFELAGRRGEPEVEQLGLGLGELLGEALVVHAVEVGGGQAL